MRAAQSETDCEQVVTDYTDPTKRLEPTLQKMLVKLEETHRFNKVRIVTCEKCNELER